MAKDNAKLDLTLKDLTKKLSKLTHRSAPPGSANTQNVSTVQTPGVHELFVTKLSGLSGRIQGVRQTHLAEYTKIQRGVDRNVAKVFRRCAQENYAFLGDALIKVGGGDAMGGLNAWGVYADAGLLPPMDFDVEEVQQDESWDAEEDEVGDLAVGGQGHNFPPRPPSAFRHHSTSGSLFPQNNTGYGQMAVSMGGQLNSAVGYTGGYPAQQPPPQVPQYPPADARAQVAQPPPPQVCLLKINTNDSRSPRQGLIRLHKDPLVYNNMLHSLINLVARREVALQSKFLPGRSVRLLSV